MEFFFDFVSPYAYLASTRIDALAARHGRQVTWKPFLIGVTVLQVMGLKPLMETPLKSDYIAHDKSRMAELLGVPIVQRDMNGVNSVAACRAYLWLAREDAGRARQFAHRVFERLWVQGLDITTPTDIAAACAAAGIESAPVLAAITTDEAKRALRVAVDEAVSRKVFGAPFFFVDGEAIWGVDRLWMVEHWLTHGNWRPAIKN